MQNELEKEAEIVLDRISSNVAKIRKEKGFSQLQLAVEIGLSGGAYIGRAELRTNGQHFNISNLVKIAKVLEVDICEFFR